ncbi:PqiB family protein [Candidatus Thiosymbion oneisti]|uniref:PqiB family protein n=1 Tax=Candidatus Thiosymbion oneisti TaxID=589554 RepID=UPI000B7D6A04|nr:MlaD family protein [Candidatus Thiosymbion oneisti]
MKAPEQPNKPQPNKQQPSRPPNQPPEAQPPEAQPPEAVVVSRRPVSLVWLIPIVALLIGGWLAYRAYTERGPSIRIEFKTAAGLEAGKTKVKFKEVEVGKVTAIDLDEDLQKVVVTAELVAGAERYLTQETRFWVARPRVTASRVSGLDTLLSGAYIAVDPVTGGEPVREFVGLEAPPLFTASEPGKKFILRSRTLGSLNVGSPVYYRHIEVGEVVGFKLDQDRKAVNIELFIAEPHDQLVLTNTRFWNASGIDLELNADGLTLDTQSMLSVLAGGVAFDTPPTLEKQGVPPAADHAFHLYASRKAAYERTYLKKEKYLLFFEGSVRGLSVGAPVLFQGIKLGRVLDVRLEFDVERFKSQIPVLIELEPQRVRLVGGDYEEVEKTAPMQRLVKEGLRAQLKSGSLITGQLYVALDFFDDAPAAEIGSRNGHPVIPSVASAQLGELTNQAAKFMHTLNALPLREIGNDLRDTVKGAKGIATSKALDRSLKALESALRQVGETARGLDKDVVPHLGTALEQAGAVLTSADNLVAPDSALYLELRRMLKELSAAARSIRGMADYLERHPEALLKGKGGLR